MDAQEIAELYDSAEDLLTAIESFGSADSDSLRKEIYRLSNALNAVRTKIPDYDHRQNEEILPIINAESESEPGEITPSQLGIHLSTLSDDNLTRALNELGMRTPIEVVDKRSTCLIRINLPDIKKMYKKQNNEECSDEKARKILKQISREYNPRLSIEQQCKTLTKDMADDNIEALSMF